MYSNLTLNFFLLNLYKCKKVFKFAALFNISVQVRGVSRPLNIFFLFLILLNISNSFEKKLLYCSNIDYRCTYKSNSYMIRWNLVAMFFSRLSKYFFSSYLKKFHKSFSHTKKYFLCAYEK